MEYIIIRNFISENESDLLIESFMNKENTSKSLNLKDGDDKTNVLYHSKRSNNLSYKYVSDHVSDSISNKVKGKLEDMLNISFSGSINDNCLPMFCYGLNGEIKAHRGVQKSKNTNTYQSYVAVLQLTQRGIDFDGGEFYLNPKATASKDGKTISFDNKSDRFYPMLNKGDICIFYNPKLVHGVETVRESKYGKSFRLTCSWRSNNEQI